MARTRRPDKAPSKKDTQTARELVQMLAHQTNVFVKVRNKQLQIPSKIVSPLIEAARLFVEGHSVAVVPTDVEISAQEAAGMLKVSRPYLLNLVKKGVLPCRMVGAHHRIPMKAVLAYRRDQLPRRRALEALTAETQELGR